MRASGIDERTPESGEEAVAGATSPLVTRDILKSELQAFRSEMYRALWIQGGVIVTLNAAIMTAVVTLAMAFGR